MGAQDAVMLILDHHHTVVCASGVVAITVTLRRRGEGKQVPQDFLWRGQMHANVINPAFDRRFRNRNQEQHGKEERNVPEADPTDHREIAGQPDHAVAHMLGGRDALDLWGEVHPLILGVHVGTLGDDKPVRDRIVERGQCMNIDMVGLLAPTDRRGCPQRTLKVQLTQIELDNRRALFDTGADKGVLVHLRDNRLKLHLHCNRHPIPLRHDRLALG